MSRIIHKVLIVAFFMLLALGVGSCVEPIDPSLRPDAPRLTFWIYVPGSMQQPATKALQGDVSSVSPESQLHDIQVWAFRHGASDDDQILSYVDVSGINWSHNGTTPRSWDDCYELSMSIPQDFLLEADPRIDFYILANWQSIFNEKPSQMKLAEVRDLVFSASTETKPTPDYFGTTTPTTAVPAKGLPISTIYKGEDGNGVSLLFLKNAIANGTSLTQNLFHENLEVIELKRTVSKLRFVFSRPDGLDGVSITRVVLNEGLIPDQNWVFEKSSPIVPTETDYGAAATLGSTATPLLTSSAIGSCEDPKTLTYDWFESNTPQGYATTAQGYDNYLRDAINFTTGNNVRKPKATEKVIYFRESDKSLIGKIYYKLSDSNDSPEYSADFTMGTLDNTYNNFRRNHYWTVYAYFEDGDLYVKPTVAPWEDTDQLSYTLKMNTNMRLFDSWLYRYDTVDQDYTNWTNWAGSHMVVSDGKVTESSATETITGRPLRSPQIQLVTTGVGATNSSFQLTVDNNNFQLVKVVKKNSENVVVTDGTGIVKEYVYSDVINITGDENVYTYFYIVPRPGVTWVDDDPNTWLDDDPDNDVRTNRVAKVSLIYNDPVTGPQKVTFNYGALPGYSDDSSEIWAYYFPADKYNISGKLKMYYKSYKEPLFPTPVQN